MANQKADSQKLKRIGPRLAQRQLEPTNLEYWRTFIRQAYRNNVNLIEYIRKLGPELEDAEKRNNRAISYFYETN